MPAVLLLPQTGWLWAGIATALSAAVLYFSQRLKLTAPFALKAILVWNLLALGASARLMCNVFPNGSALLGLLILLLASYAASKGRNVLLRVGGVCVFLLLIIYGVLLGFSLPDLSAAELSPKTDIAWLVLPAALTPLLALQLREENETVHLLWLVCMAVFATLAALVSSGSADFYSAMKSVSVMDVMQRLEPLVSVALTIGGFCLLGMICFANEKLLSQVYPQKKKFAMPINLIVGGVGLWVSAFVSGAFYAVGTAIFWGCLPLLTQVVEKLKKPEKN